MITVVVIVIPTIISTVWLSYKKSIRKSKTTQQDEKKRQHNQHILPREQRKTKYLRRFITFVVYWFKRTISTVIISTILFVSCRDGYIYKLVPFILLFPRQLFIQSYYIISFILFVELHLVVMRLLL